MKTTYDPTQPLPNARYERMIHLNLTGLAQYECWRETGKRRTKKDIAMIRASEVFARPDVCARREFLRKEQTAAAPPPPAMRPAIILPKGPEATLLLAQRKACEALQLAETPQDIVKAVSACKELGVIQPEGEQPPDPTLVLQAILSYAGRTGEQICEQLGGLAFMLDKFITVCKVNPSELREVLNSRYPREN